MIKAIIFDLDGTLLPMNQDKFVKIYFGLLTKKLEPYGYDKDDLISAIWAGTKAAVKNDGSHTNEEVFWDIFAAKYGKENLKHKAIFDEFYINEFKETIAACGKNDLAKNAISLAKSKNLRLILASNPVFPLNGLLTRMKFVGLEKDDFDYITSYENSHYSKPNPKYFEEILNVNNLKADEVIVFGNSEEEDIAPAESLGIKSYLIDDEKGIKFEKVLEIINNA